MKHDRVILADGHEEMLEGVRGLLESRFDVVTTAADERSLFEAVRTVRPDLAVVDLSLPSASGLNVMHAFRRMNPEVKMIVLSCHDEQTVVDECMKAGVCGYVLKRSAAQDLIPAVEAVMGGGEYISPSVEGGPGYPF
jgi:DNA-binding NarL/FixJ family response regulator